MTITALDSALRKAPYLVVDEVGNVTLAKEKPSDGLSVCLMNRRAQFRSAVLPRQRFVTPQAQQLSGASYRQIQFWEKNGLIEALNAPDDRARGVDRWWSFETVFTICLLTWLRFHHQPLDVLRSATNLLRQFQEASATS